MDGLTVDMGDWWANLRPSNTEFLPRLNLEAADDDEVARRADEVEPPQAEPHQRGRPRLTGVHDTRRPALGDPRLSHRQAGPAVFRRRRPALQPESLKKAYRVHEDSVMLPDEAIDVADDEHARLTEKAEAEGSRRPSAMSHGHRRPRESVRTYRTNCETSQWPADLDQLPDAEGIEPVVVLGTGGARAPVMRSRRSGTAFHRADRGHGAAAQVGKDRTLAIVDAWVGDDLCRRRGRLRWSMARAIVAPPPVVLGTAAAAWVSPSCRRSRRRTCRWARRCHRSGPRAARTARFRVGHDAHGERRRRPDRRTSRPLLDSPCAPSR